MAFASCRFGPFIIDRGGYRVFRDGRPLALTSQQFDLLLFLVDHADQLVTKEALLEALWPHANVTENALTQAMSELRQVLGDHPRAPRYIRTIARRGYRFVAPVEAGGYDGARDIATGEPGTAEDASGAFVDGFAQQDDIRPLLVDGIGAATAAPRLESALPRVPVRDTPSLDAAKAWTEGWLRIETLSIRELAGAIADFTRAVSHDPRHASAYAGLATAEGALYESTRCDQRPDDRALVRAMAHARRAIELDDSLAEAHATLAMLLVSAWQTPEAVARARRAVALEPWQWRHQFRLCHAAWGDARLEAAARTSALYPAFAFAHFQMAMVYVARGQLAQAHTVLLHGVTVQDQQIERRQRFPALGLHWLRGLVLLAEGDPLQAAREFQREEGLADLDRLYGREYAMSAWLGHAFALLRAGRPDGSVVACQRVLELYPAWSPGHLALVQTCRALGDRAGAEEALASADIAVRTLEGRQPIEGAIARAQFLTTQGQLDDAIEALARLLKEAPPGFAGWSLPIDPLFTPLHTRPGFPRVLKLLADRAR
jgi:DNA-binding winged helix-turn-helix (wHTH) protein